MRCCRSQSQGHLRRAYDRALVPGAVLTGRCPNHAAVYQFKLQRCRLLCHLIRPGEAAPELEQRVKVLGIIFTA